MSVSPRQFSRARRAALALVTIPAALALAGCSLLSDGVPVRDDGGSVSEAGRADVNNIEVGDCLDATTNDTVYQVPVVPCAEEHDEEVFGEFHLPPGDYPGDDVIEAQGWEECDAKFQEFIGVAYDDSEIDYYTLTPTQDSWEDFSDRSVMCIASDPAGKTVGTLAGAGR